MDRALRIIGVAIVVALPVFAYRAFDRAVSAAPSESSADTSTGTRADIEVGSQGQTGSPSDQDGSQDPDGNGDGESDADGDSDGQLDAFGEPPEYLAFDAGKQGLDARVYRVADDPDVRDRDVEIDRSDYPEETDLIADFSLASVDEIEPGLYASSFAAEGCSYELRRVNRSGEDRLIGQERLGQGRLLVSLNPIEPDVFSSVPQCQSWTPWSPLVEPLVQATAGDYWIGDLARGTWLVPEGCLWEKVVGFRGARLADVTDSGWGPDVLIVDEDTLGVRIRGCERPIELGEAEPAPGIGFEPGLDP